MDTVNLSLRTYRFDGTDWTQVGNGLGITLIALPSLAALNSTDVAFVGAVGNLLTRYRFDGTN